jgi:hypothetical protein
MIKLLKFIDLLLFGVLLILKIVELLDILGFGIEYDTLADEDDAIGADA